MGVVSEKPNSFIPTGTTVSTAVITSAIISRILITPTFLYFSALAKNIKYTIKFIAAKTAPKIFIHPKFIDFTPKV